MCFFPKKIEYKDTFGRIKTLESGCGCCPECLHKRSRQWALRGYYQSLEAPAMMICLTYDSYIYNSLGKIIGERVNSHLRCSKRDAQLFIKKLRKWISTHVDGNPPIKYIFTAERGKRTNRPHYHAIIFGYAFDDCVFYKMSKKGYPIYKSATLTQLWGKGICTVDSKNVTPAVVSYCTKYCSKDNDKQKSDTFMLFSRGIGENGLLSNFNGLRYIVNGHDYAIPRTIWNKVIEARYIHNNYFVGKNLNLLGHPIIADESTCVPCSYKYRGRAYDNKTVEFFRIANRNFRFIRERDEQYNNYIKFWSTRVEDFDKLRPSIVERVKLLPNDKYFIYKQAVLDYFERTKNGEFLPFIPREKHTISKLERRYTLYKKGHLALSSRSLTPNDTDISYRSSAYTSNRDFWAEYRDLMEFHALAKRYDVRLKLETEWSKFLNPYKSKKFCRKVLTFSKPCVNIGTQGSFVTHTTMQ